ncbi:sensor histidine kinase [Nocardiopsis algeriensis]|uniref:sensor histidine kinase n=1 Tax=Nocardiopsis algeriensis TaxID=1478215 RepID=UPI003B42B6F7
MPVHEPSRNRTGPGRQAATALLTVTAPVSLACAWTAAVAPVQDRPVLAAVTGALALALCAAGAVTAYRAGAARGAREHGGRTGDRTLEQEVGLLTDHLLPALVEGARGGRSLDEVLAEQPRPGHPALDRLARALGTELLAAGERAVRIEQQVADLDRFWLPLVTARIREDRVSAPERLAAEYPEVHDTVASLREHLQEELVAADRRAGTAAAAAAVLGSRIRSGLPPGPDTARAAHLADNLLTLAEGRATRRRTRPVPVRDLLRDAAHRIGDAHRVRHRAPDGALVDGHAAEALTQVLAELLDNALRFSDPGSEVHVLAAEDEHTGLTVSVEDSGPGLRRSEHERAQRLLAEPPGLASLEDERTGLAVVARLADRHGLTVDLRPSPLGGTSASVLVPPHLIIREHTQQTRSRRHRAAVPPTAAPSPVPRFMSPPLSPPAPPAVAPAAPLSVPSAVAPAFAPVCEDTA